MPETETNPAKPRRFPIIGALLCAACVGAAAWTWMRYSYCWDVEPLDLWESGRTEPQYERLGTYVRVHGDDVGDVWDWESPDHHLPQVTGFLVYHRGKHIFSRVEVQTRALWEDASTRTYVAWPSGRGSSSQAGSPHYVARPATLPRDAKGRVAFRGRVIWPPGNGTVLVDVAASRFHPASIAGLVVGAMGVFVFTVALRDWLRERRKFGEEARA